MANETVSFDITQDNIDEEDIETIIVDLTSPNNLVLMTVGFLKLQISITDDDAFAAVSIATTATGSEAVANPDVTVTISAVSGRDVTVDYASTVNGTAEGSNEAETADFQNFTATPLTISAGSLTNTFSFSVNNDEIDEVDIAKTIIYTIANPQNATLGNATQTYTIQDNDPEPTCGFSTATSNVTELDDNDANHAVYNFIRCAFGKDITRLHSSRSQCSRGRN